MFLTNSSKHQLLVKDMSGHFSDKLPFICAVA